LAASPTRSAKSGILAGIRVLDLSQVVSGPSASMVLADLGAEVIKVERPNTGEPYRHEGHVIANDAGAVSVNYLRFNRSKKSLSLDLKKPAGRAVLRRLAQRSDVLLENFRPGVMERLGLGYQDLVAMNPRLIFASISGFGQLDTLPGPHSDLPAYAIIAEGYAGLLDLVGESEDRPPHWLGFALADLAAGLFGLAGILGALFARERTGRGARLDVAMYDAALFMNEQAICLYSTTGHLTHRGPYRYQAPWGIFGVRDGYVSLAVMGTEQWAALCDVAELPDLRDDARCATGELRAKHMPDFIEPRLSSWLMSHTRDEVVTALQHVGVPCGPVNTAADIFNSPHVAARRMLIDVKHPVAGNVTTVGNPIKFLGDSEIDADAPAALGADTDAILRDLLGMDELHIARLRAEGVV
jgi:formyl-CoA transferase